MHPARFSRIVSLMKNPPAELTPLLTNMDSSVFVEAQENLKELHVPQKAL
jgi:hypothetical protein